MESEGAKREVLNTYICVYVCIYTRILGPIFGCASGETASAAACALSARHESKSSNAVRDELFITLFSFSGFSIVIIFSSVLLPFAVIYSLCSSSVSVVFLEQLHPLPPVSCLRLEDEQCCPR
jgi:hypothetical protein